MTQLEYRTPQPQPPERPPQRRKSRVRSGFELGLGFAAALIVCGIICAVIMFNVLEVRRQSAERERAAAEARQLRDLRAEEAALTAELSSVRAAATQRAANLLSQEAAEIRHDLEKDVQNRVLAKVDWERNRIEVSPQQWSVWLPRTKTALVERFHRYYVLQGKRFHRVQIRDASDGALLADMDEVDGAKVYR